MKRFSIVTVAVLCLVMGSVARAYDVEMAASYAKLFAPVVGAGAGKALHFMKPDAFVTAIKSGKAFVTIDIRTPAEASVFTMALPNSLIIPTHRVFQPENLKRIPRDKPVMIICKSGARASAVGTALRHIGFSNVYILKGGFQALAAYYGPKEAYQTPETAAK